MAVNFAILGCGDIAAHMANAVELCPEVNPLAVAARDESRAKAFAEKHGFARYYGSYEAMLQDDDVELVYIALPHALHHGAAVMCLNAGKNIVIEKPFTANAQQAREIIDLAKAKGLMAAEGLWMRYMPTVAQVKNMCESGMIGEVKMLTGEIGYHLTQARLFDPNMAGGALLDVGVYTLALAGTVFGYDVAEIRSDAQLNDCGVDEINSFVLKYKSGQMASFSTSMTYMSSCRGTVWGSKGYADIENVNRLSPVHVYDQAHEEIACYANTDVKNSYVFELRSLVKALGEGRLDTPEVPHEDIIQRIQLMDALRKQWNLRYPFELDEQ